MKVCLGGESRVIAPKGVHRAGTVHWSLTPVTNVCSSGGNLSPPHSIYPNGKKLLEYGKLSKPKMMSAMGCVLFAITF